MPAESGKAGTLMVFQYNRFFCKNQTVFCLPKKCHNVIWRLFVIRTWVVKLFSNFSCRFLNPNIFFSNLNFNSSNLSSLRNLQEQVKKAFCYQKLFWPFIVWINCSSDLKNFANSQPSALNFKFFTQSWEQFFTSQTFVAITFC